MSRLPLSVSFIFALVLLPTARAHAGDAGEGGTTCGSVGVTCGPSDGGLVDDGGTCVAVGGRCVGLDAGAVCGELLSGLPCRSGTMCCVISSANADGAASFDGAVCVSVGSACVPGDSCCQGASCASYAAGGAFVCGYPPLDAGVGSGAASRHSDAAACVPTGSACASNELCCGGSTCGPSDAGTRVCGAHAGGHDAGATPDAGSHAGAPSSGCSCRTAAGNNALWPCAAPVLFWVRRRRKPAASVDRGRASPRVG
jgi:hypothetical protein